MKRPQQPIGLFDSGFGGLTVMKEVALALPQENLVYFGDTAHLPYGNKSPETILQFALNNATFLMNQNIKLLVIACHSACSHALQTLQEKLPIPVIGITEAGLRLAEQREKIAILATTSTIQSGIYQKALSHKEHFAIDCPLFVPLIEEGYHDHPSTRLIAESYLNSIQGKVDSILLACTHYPLIKPTLEKIFGPTVSLIEPAKLCAEQVRLYLTHNHLLNTQTEFPSLKFYVSDDPEKFKRLGKIFFGKAIEKVEKK
jgi:glutamate racemase